MYGELGGPPSLFLEELRWWQNSVIICIQVKVFSVVQLEVYFIIHGLGIKIVLKFILHKLRLFTGWKVRIEKKLYSRFCERREAKGKQSFGWRLLPLDCKIQFSCMTLLWSCNKMPIECDSLFWFISKRSRMWIAVLLKEKSSVAFAFCM